MSFKAAYQGIAGSYSGVALEKLFVEFGEPVRLTGVPTYRHVAAAVVSGGADVGLLPVDNAIAGTVRDGYDLLAQYDLVPLREVEYRPSHRLLGVRGSALVDIREVWGHPLALAECGRFLATLAGARSVPAADTGSAARDVAAAGDPSRAVVGPDEAAQIYGLEELARDIADHPDDVTRFLLFCASGACEKVRALGGRTARRKTSLLLSTRHEQGALARCLGVFAEANINLLKLESRPKLGKPGEHLFYVDFEGDEREPNIAAALERLQRDALELRVIGSYDAGSVARPGATSDVKKTFASRPEEEPVPTATAANWPKAARGSRPQGSRLHIGDVVIGGTEFVVIAGPCSVESRGQVRTTADFVKSRGARLLRGGAFKPRTNPYAFQGLGWEGVSLLAEAGRATGLPTVSEVMSVDQVERMAREIDVLQIGARNMQNFDLLKAVGRTQSPVLLKRGLSASLDELLAAAEYILSEGNPNVALCERGIRTFETATRNTLDLSAVPVLRERTHLPILVDPSHGVGVRRWIRPLCRAAKAVGAHGIIVEVHPNPPEAKSDRDQALTFEDFSEIVAELQQIPYYAARAVT